MGGRRCCHEESGLPDPSFLLLASTMLPLLQAPTTEASRASRGCYNRLSPELQTGPARPANVHHVPELQWTIIGAVKSNRMCCKAYRRRSCEGPPHGATKDHGRHYKGLLYELQRATPFAARPSGGATGCERWCCKGLPAELSAADSNAARRVWRRGGQWCSNQRPMMLPSTVGGAASSWVVVLQGGVAELPELVWRWRLPVMRGRGHVREDRGVVCRGERHARRKRMG
jgi:hypothetical protein